MEYSRTAAITKLLKAVCDDKQPSLCVDNRHMLPSLCSCPIGCSTERSAFKNPPTPFHVELEAYGKRGAVKKVSVDVVRIEHRFHEIYLFESGIEHASVIVRKSDESDNFFRLLLLTDDGTNSYLTYSKAKALDAPPEFDKLLECLKDAKEYTPSPTPLL